jgi:hypothetical protein
LIRQHIEAGKKNVMADLEQRQAIRGLRAVALDDGFKN